MRRAFVVFAILIATCVFAIKLSGQESSLVTVKASEPSGTVLIVSASRNVTQNDQKASLELQCNKGVSSCVAPKPGTYVMVKLPPNWGMYECANVQLYPGSADPQHPQNSARVGEYCLDEK